MKMNSKRIGLLAAVGGITMMAVSLISGGSSVNAQTATPTPTATATQTGTATPTATATATGTATPTATATGTATATATATATPTPGPGGFASAPVFSTTGLSQVVFNGGTVVQLETAMTGAAANGAWAQTSTGQFHVYIVGGGFVNDAFKAAFPNGFAGVTALTLVRTAS